MSSIIPKNFQNIVTTGIATTGTIGNITASTITTSNLIVTNITSNNILTTDINSITASIGNIITTNISSGTNSTNLQRIYRNSSFLNNENGSHGIQIYSTVGPNYISAASLWIGADATNNIGYISVAKAGASLNLMLAANGGNVGIGNSAPSFKLDVNGNSRIATSLTTGALYSTNLTSTNIVATTSTIPNIIHTNITTNSILATSQISSANVYSTNVTSTNIVATTSTIPNIIHTNITTNSILATTQISSSNIYSTNVTSTNIVGTNISSNVLLTSNITTNSILATSQISTGNVFSTNLTSTNIVGTNISSSTLTTTDIFNTNITTVSLLATSITSGEIIATSISASSSIRVGASFIISGAFSGPSVNVSTVLGNSKVQTPFVTSTNILSNNITSGSIISTNNTLTNLILTSGSFGSLTTNNISVSGNITVGGNLLVQGSLISVNVTSVNVINNNITTSSLNAGSISSSTLNLSGDLNITNGNIIVTSGNLIVSGDINTSNITSTNIFGTNISTGELNVNFLRMPGVGRIQAGGSGAFLEIYNTDGSNIPFFITNNNANTKFLSIATNGNVGIGTTSPEFKLDVNGNSRIATSLTTGALYSTNLTSTNIVATTSTIPNIIHTNITTNSILVSSQISSANVYSTNVTSTNIVATNITSTNIIATSSTIPNIISTSINTITQRNSYLEIGGTQPVFNNNTLGSLFISGTDNNPNGGHILMNTSEDQFPTLHLLNYGHNNTYMAFDAYYDGVRWRNSTNDVAMAIVKLSNQLRFTYQLSNGAGSISTFGQLFNTVAMLVGSTGNIGMGQLTPIFKLDVSGTARITTSLTTGALYSTNLTSTNIVATTSTIPNIIHTNITTSSILASSQVSSANVYSTNVTSTNIVSTLMSTGTIQFGVANNGLRWGTGLSRIYEDGQLRIFTDDQMFFHIGNTTSSAMFINVSRNIGINTTSPVFTLDVNGSIDAGTFLTSGNVYSTNVTSTNIVGTNISSNVLLTSNITTNSILATSQISTGNVYSTNLTSTNIVGENISSSTLTSTNIFNANITTDSLLATSQIRLPGIIQQSFNRAFTASANGVGDIVSFNGPQSGSYNFDIDVMTSGGSQTYSAKYKISAGYNMTSNAWARCIPYSSFNNNTDAYELQIRGNGRVTTFRLVHSVIGAASIPTVNFLVTHNLNDIPAITDLTGNALATDATWATNNFLQTTALTQINNQVGINTLTPTFTLDVNGSINAGTFLTSGNVYSTNVTSTNIVATNISSSTLNLTNIIATSSTISNLRLSNGLNSSFNSNTLGTLYTTDGNVGINTTSPGASLHIGGNAYVGPSVYTTTGSGGLDKLILDPKLIVNSQAAGLPATTGTVGNAIALRLRGRDDAVLDMGVNTGNGSWIQSTNFINYNTKYDLLLNPNGGNVGVNTLDAVFNLDVSGSMRVTGNITTSSMWTTYSTALHTRSTNMTISNYIGINSSISNLTLTSGTLGSLNVNNMIVTNISASNAIITNVDIGSNFNKMDYTIPNPTNSTYAIPPSSDASINGVNITALNRRVRPSNYAQDKSVNEFIARNIPTLSSWYGICWAPELGIFCSLSRIDTLAMTSPDGIKWTTHSISLTGWGNVCWSPELGLFCAARYTPGSSLITSPDGVNWTVRTVPSAQVWFGICWSPELGLFCLTSASSAAVITSPDGINWTEYSIPSQRTWSSVCWAPELSVFCAVNQSNNANVMTSPDGINWTEVAIPTGRAYRCITWAPELSMFCAVTLNGVAVVLTSYDAITWTERTIPNGRAWYSVSWAPEISMFCAVNNISAAVVMTSPNGINWTERTLPVNQKDVNVCWSPELSTFCIVNDNSNASVFISKMALPTSYNTLLAPESQLMIDNSGNIGIGTSSPTTNLDVNGNIRLPLGNRITANANDNFIYSSNTVGHYSTMWAVDQATGSGPMAYLSSYGGIRMFTLGLPRMLIDISGNVGINTTSPGFKLDVSGNSRISTSLTTGALYSTNITSSNIVGTNISSGTLKLSNILIAGFNSNTLGNLYTTGGNVGINTTSPTDILQISNVMLMASSGNLTVSGEVLAFGTISDQRLKTNIENINNGIDTINNLRPVTFSWKETIFNKQRRGTSDSGFIAQEVEPIIPHAVGEFCEIESGEIYKNMRHERIIPYLVKAIQELNLKVETLSNQNIELQK
jgi:hypothetical protein